MTKYMNYRFYKYSIFLNFAQNRVLGIGDGKSKHKTSLASSGRNKDTTDVLVLRVSAYHTNSK